jgi:hypothetical protein
VTETEKKRTTNPYEVTFAGEENFTVWDWGDAHRPDAFVAAEIFLEEIRDNTMPDLQWLPGGETEFVFGLFEYNVKLSVPVNYVVRYWIESNSDGDGRIDGEEEITNLRRLLADLQAAARLAEEALTRTLSPRVDPDGIQMSGGGFR